MERVWKAEIVTAALVLDVIPPLLASAAVIVLEPVVTSASVKLTAPEERAVFGGIVALPLVEVKWILSAGAPETIFQLASTAFTVTVKSVPALCDAGVPVFPVEEPGEAVSPGSNICNLLNAPVFTVIDELVLAVIAPLDASDAVTVCVPAVLNVKLKVCEPADSVLFTGSVALASLEVMAIEFAGAVEIRFQLASTARTVMLV